MLKGTPLEDALRRTSDPEDYASWCELDRLWQEHPAWQSAEAKEICERRDKIRTRLECGFVEALVAGDLVASGFKHPIDPTSRRVMLASDLWELLEINYLGSEASGAGLRIIRIEVLKPQINIERINKITPFRFVPIPEFSGISASAPPTGPHSFTHNEDFSVVAFGDVTFKFGAAAANVVRILHENASTVGGWMHGKKVLADAGANGTKMGDLFKRHEDPDWELLIEGDGRGHYRLRPN
jgi:hypothetical protein